MKLLLLFLLPFLRRHRFSHVFQHDNARCHVAGVSMDFLNDNHIRTLPWPALSPDVKLVKHLRDELGRRVRNGLNPPETLDELRRALIQEWNNIPQTFIRNLNGSTLSNSFLMLCFSLLWKMTNSDEKCYS
jgi:acyl carrier protein phosphodiesterase